MDIDLAKLDDAVLALLYLTLHDEVRAWKGMDWDALGRLLPVSIAADALASFHSVGDERVLDHSAEVLGLD